MSETRFNVGKIVNTHGIKGEVKVLLQTDFPEVRFQKGSKLLLVDAALKKELSVVVESGRPQRNVYIVKFSGLNDINEAETLKGWLIKVNAEDLLELEEDEYYYHEILGCRVLTEEGQELGLITEILTPGANDVWVVTPPQGKGILIPVIDDVLLHVDVAEKVVTIRLMEGLID
jgi:16S rRNA processing protein RimM